MWPTNQHLRGPSKAVTSWKPQHCWQKRFASPLSNTCMGSMARCVKRQASSAQLK